jgi:hypothetical protein
MCCKVRLSDGLRLIFAASMPAIYRAPVRRALWRAGAAGAAAPARGSRAFTLKPSEGNHCPCAQNAFAWSAALVARVLHLRHDPHRPER